MSSTFLGHDQAGPVMPSTIRCSLAPPGSFGHECGRPAQFVRASASERTRSGWFYAGRCGSCAYLPGGENIGTTAPEPLDLSQHVNHWR